MKELLERLKRIESLLMENQSPRLSKDEARKFMKMGNDKFSLLVKRGIIKEFLDHFGERYYLKQQLMKVLSEPLVFKKVN